MKTHNQTCITITAPIMAVLLLLAVASPVTAQVFRKWKPQIKRGNHALYTPSLLQRALESKVSHYANLPTFKLQARDVWEIANNRQTPRVFENRVKLIAALNRYTQLKTPDAVIHIKPDMTVGSYGQPKLHEGAYLMFEVPQEIKFIERNYTHTLNDSQVILRPANRVGPATFVNVSDLADKVNPLRQPLSTQFAQLSKLPVSRVDFWEKLGGNKEGTPYSHLFVLQGHLATFFEHAPEEIAGKPIGETKVNLRHGEYEVYDIYELPLRKITLKDVTYTRENSVVMVRNLEKSNSIRNSYDIDAKWDPYNPDVMIQTKEELNTSNNTTNRTVTWFNN